MYQKLVHLEKRLRIIMYLYLKIEEMKNMKKLLKTALAASMLVALTACAKDNFQVEESYTVELGSKVSTEAKAYLAKDTDKEVLKDTVITFKKDKAYSVDKKSKSLKPAKGKYLPVGKYHATAAYDDEKESFVVEVKDTKAPTFVDLKEEIIIEVNAENVDLSKYFKAEDLSETKISVDKAKLDLTKEGTYGITVTATDTYKNAKAEKVVVKVVSLEVAEKNGVTVMSDGTKPQSKALKEKTAKDTDKQETQQGQGNANAGANTNTYAPPVSNNNRPSGNTGNGTPNNPVTPPAQKPQNPGVCVPEYSHPGDDGKVYHSQQEAWDAGWVAVETEGSPFYMKAFSVVGRYDNCDNIYYVLVFRDTIQ